MLLWLIVVSIIAFYIGMLYGEYKTMNEAIQLLFESKQALISAKEHNACAKALLETIDETLIQEAAPKT